MEKTKISELEANKGANVEGEIIKLDQAKEVRTKFGKLTKTQKTIIQDSSGKIELCLWDDYCDKFNKGDKIEIKGGWVSEYKGELQLSTGKFGKIEKTSIESEPLAAFKNATTTKDYDKTGFVPANTLKSGPSDYEVKEWGMKRGGYGHDAATIVASRKEEYKTTADAIKAAIEHTDSLVKAAEEREIRFRKGGV